MEGTTKLNKKIEQKINELKVHKLQGSEYNQNLNVSKPGHVQFSKNRNTRKTK